MKQNVLDTIIINTDRVVRTLLGTPVTTERENPAKKAKESPLSEQDKRYAAGLIRVNHAGEVCAQALYQGQALTARQAAVQESMLQAAIEENDHLAWTDERLTELGSHTSYLNPLWYGGSLAIGTLAGLIGDKWSLGFVAETERQVVKHLDSHLEKLPVNDHKSRAIVQQMKIDEEKHATHAVAAGAAELPQPVKKLMTLTSKIMTTLAFRI